MTLWLTTLLFIAEPLALERTVVVLDAAVTASNGEVTAALGAPGSATTIIREEAQKDSELEDQKKLVRLALETLKVAKKAALELRTDEAIQKFEEAQNLFGRGIAALDDYSIMAQSLIDLGAAFIDARKDDKATAAFRRALALGVSVKPDPKVYNPEVLQRFAKVEREVVRAARGSMTIVSKPEGAEVYFDGRRVGTTPVSLNDLLLGEHWVNVRHPGHHRFSARVLVNKDRVEKTEVFLRVLPASQSAEVKLIEAARKGGIDRTAASDLMRATNAGSIIVVLSGAPLRALAFDQKNGERAASAESFDALARVLRSAPATITAPIERPEEKPIVVKPEAKPIVLKTAVRRDVHPMVAILPAGIGQFAEGRHGWGAFFLTTQALLLAANITSFFLVQGDRLPGTTPPEYGNPQRSEALKWVANIGFGLLIADVIIGGIDGVLHRKAD